MTGDELRQIRKKLGMSQPEFGKAVGFPEKSAQIQISRYETGARPVAERVELRARLLVQDMQEANK